MLQSVGRQWVLFLVRADAIFVLESDVVLIASVLQLYEWDEWFHRLDDGCIKMSLII